MSQIVKKKNGAGWNKGISSNKATNEQIEQRTELVVKFLLGNPAATDFEIHKKFKKKFGLHWTTINQYAIRARKVIRRHAKMSLDEAKGLGVSVLIDTIKKPNSPAIRLKAENALRSIYGYAAPIQTRIGNPDGSPLPATVVVAPTVIFEVVEKKKEIGNE
jgi:hypothetical protein